MAKSNYPSDAKDKFMLRLPDGMRDRIRAAAEARGVSMNSEIVDTLAKAYPGNPAIDELAAEIVAKVEAFKREADPVRQEKLMEDMQDLNTLLQYELSLRICSTDIADDIDDLKFI